MKQSVLQQATLAGNILLALMAGYLIGRMMTVQIALSNVAPIELKPDTRPSVAVVRIDGVRDGHVHGHASSGVRLFIGDTYIGNTQSGSFTAAAGPLLVHEQTVRIPPGMRFVASKKGKKYYPVLSAGGENIVPANRVYFATGEAAERAGYRL